MPATTLLAQLQGIERLGLDRPAIERDVLSEIGAWPAESDGLIPVAGYLRMWQSATAQFGAGLPTALALAIPFGAFGMIDYLAGSADTLTGSIASLELHLAALTADTKLRHESDDGGNSRITITVGGSNGAMVEEFTVAVLVSRFAQLTAPAVRPMWVGLRVESTAAMRGADPGTDLRPELLRAPVLFGQPVTSFTLHSDDLKRSLRQSDPYLHATLSAMARQLRVDAQPSGELEQAIRARLRDALGQGRAEPAVIARLLGLSERTLQRRLAELDRSFSAVVEDFRREEAARLLAEPHRTLVDVAARLGYAEQTSFTRAFRRWTGSTPGRWRRNRMA